MKVDLKKEYLMSIVEEFTKQQNHSYTILKKTRNYKALIKYRAKQCSTIDGFITNLVSKLYTKARTKGYVFNLSTSFLIDLYTKQNGRCALSNIPMTISNSKEYRINKFNISVDRINSSKGYTKDNVWLVCASINLMKLDHTTEQFIELCKAVTYNNAV